MGIMTKVCRSYAALLALLAVGLGCTVLLVFHVVELPKADPVWMVKVISLPVTGCACGTILSLMCVEYKRRRGELRMLEGLVWPEDEADRT
ncbi:hypothetical protein DES53_106146 [Roseimicrobium gellanilyticum]|uniref:Uncharacterized protein n=1 Tax=Roseimicrobium gellanilyticum TaxID=748857 RepID=A0A366HKA7_9BACT|nr:hypothetical protein [Roseimicrobium gellanilyticum]RBP42439.1 hypothetical protein DES53_106146 [Roseimicrobium gellanilyticum]